LDSQRRLSQLSRGGLQDPNSQVSPSLQKDLQLPSGCLDSQRRLSHRMKDVASTLP
jgi:hypothetical protein